MKNWNKIGKVKAVILVILFLPNLFYSVEFENLPSLIILIIFPLIAFGILMPVSIYLNFKRNPDFFEIAKPNWNDNLLNRKKPLSQSQFSAFFFISIGISVLIGSGINLGTFNPIGVTAISAGIGLLLGIKLTLKGVKI